MTSLEPIWARATEPRDFSRNDDSVAMQASPDAIWLVSDNTVYEIRLRNLSVRALLQNVPQIRSLGHSKIKGDDKPRLQLLVRTAEGLLIMDHATETTKFVRLEPLPRLTYESFYQLSDGRGILEHVNRSRVRSAGHVAHRITWLDADGQIERQAEVVTQSNGRSGDQMLPWCCPAPINPYGLLLMVPWLDERSRGAAASERYGRFVSEFFTVLMFTSIIGFGTGWACRRRERDVLGRTGWLWPIMVGLCGWFGWMAYICLNPLPARLPNRRWMPIQPEPNVPIGTEIFA